MRGSEKICAKRGTTKFSSTKIDADAHQRQQAGINQRADDVAAQIVAGALEFGQPLENLRQRPGASPARTMLMYSSEKCVGCVARLSASDFPPLSTRSTSSTSDRKSRVLGQLRRDRRARGRAERRR